MSDQVIPTPPVDFQAPAPAPDSSSAPVAPLEVAPAVSTLSVGQAVSYDWDDPYDGPSSQKGIVTSIPQPGQVTVGWFDGESGPMSESELRAL
jgi:hypothetical protein